MPSAWVRPQQKPDPEAIPFYLGARESAAQDESGRVLAGRYELVEVLASGGTAVVYTAVDSSTGGEVAVKVLYEAAREVVGAFFGQEGRLAARIQSPHLVHARHFGEEDGRLFIVFDLVPGVALPDMYFQELMPWRELCVIVLQVLAGLNALHQGGIVHRDVKPDNVIVQRTLGDEVHVTLLDLGFAWVPPERNLTGAPEPTRQVFGTDRFIAPELLGGGLPEPRNDLYSVGALMYSMLTAQCVPDLSAAPELMELPSPRAFVPGLSQSIDDIVMRALSDVQARFQSAEEMAAAIRVALTEDAAASSATPRVSRGERSAGTTSPPARDWHAVGGFPAASALSAASPATDAPSKADLGAGMATQTRPAQILVVQGADVSAVPVVLPARSMPTKDTSAAGPRQATAAAMLLSALLGGAAVWFAGPSPDIVVATAREVPEATDPPPAKELGSMPELPVLREPATAEPAAPATAVVPPDRRADALHPAVLAAGEKPRSRAAAAAAGAPDLGRTQSFPKAMKRLESDISDCIARKTGKEPTQAIEVRVRFGSSSSAIDQVRVLNMGAANPVARCIDESVRGASPPSAGRPNETFTFFKDKGTGRR